MKTIKITESTLNRAMSIINNMSNVNTLVFHKGNFFGATTSVGAEIFSSSVVRNVEDLNDLKFVTQDENKVMFEVV